MKKKTYLYFECDLVNGKRVLGVEVDYPITLGELMDAENDLKRIILAPCEKIIQRRSKPRSLNCWETYQKPWCIVGSK